MEKQRWRYREVSSITVLTDGCWSEVHEFDAVVVSNGQYTVPNIPDIKSIDRFDRPCLHSHLYRNADPFRGKTVVIHGQPPLMTDLWVSWARFVQEAPFPGKILRCKLDSLPIVSTFVPELI